MTEDKYMNLTRFYNARGHKNQLQTFNQRGHKNQWQSYSAFEPFCVNVRSVQFISGHYNFH